VQVHYLLAALFAVAYERLSVPTINEDLAANMEYEVELGPIRIVVLILSHNAALTQGNTKEQFLAV
jgi:hypothetical protein